MNDSVSLRRFSDAAVAQMRALANTLADDLQEQEGPLVEDHRRVSDTLFDALSEAAVRCEVQTEHEAAEDRRLDQAVRRHMVRGAL